MALAAEDKSFLMKEGVYEHLGKIINRVIAEKPVDGHGMIEVLSRLVKDPGSQVKVEFTDKDVEAFAEQVKKAQLLDKAPLEDGGEESAAAGAVPNVVEEAEMFAWAGVGLGEQESYKVMCSLRNMAVKNKDKYQQIRLWGKILGTSADYWVAEATIEGEEPETETMDKPGEGVNQFAYLITTDLAGKWEQLPHIQPEQIVAARLIRRIFTGIPNAKVVTHPFFNGTERVLLRAQIARISADTVLCPKGKLWRGEDYDPKSADEPPPVISNDEFAVPLPSQLLGKENWTHMVPYIRKDGKTAQPVNPSPDGPPDEEDPEAKAAFVAYTEQVEEDPPQDAIRALTEDHMEWVVKQAGDTALYRDTTTYANMLDTTKTRSNAVAFVRSLVWPGAVTASSKGYFSNLYIGYGLKAGDPDFFPAAPPDVQDEPIDPGEQPEPQGELAPEGEPAEGEDQG